MVINKKILWSNINDILNDETTKKCTYKNI